MTQKTYPTSDAQLGRIRVEPRNIKERIDGNVLIEGIHYNRPFGSCKILRIWVHIEKDYDPSLRIYEMAQASRGVCHG